MPTKEQWFWEQCGFTTYVDRGFTTWYYPNGEISGYHSPPIDLNNLFKYAVPKLFKYELGYDDYYKKHYAIAYTADDIWVKREDNQCPALALFWAIFKALGGKE